MTEVPSSFPKSGRPSWKRSGYHPEPNRQVERSEILGEIYPLVMRPRLRCLRQSEAARVSAYQQLEQAAATRERFTDLRRSETPQYHTGVGSDQGHARFLGLQKSLLTLHR